MSRRSMRSPVVLVAFLLVVVSLVAAGDSASAADTVTFVSDNRSSTPLQGNPVGGKRSWNANGAIITVGNNLLSCAPGTNCVQAQGGNANYDNNNFGMVDLDQDGLAGTRNSSSSTLNLPAGATVLWAGLYWGARLTGATSSSTVTQADARTMKFRGPTDGSAYRDIAAEYFFGPNTQSYNAYQGFHDVTSLVQAQGSGEYWGADVAAGLGSDRYAGWAMTVVYSAPGMPLRNLTVFDGFEMIQQGGQRSVTVSGFVAPPSGSVDAQLTMVAYEGDFTLTGDYTMLNNTQLASGASPGSNFFNSTNDLNGSISASRNPAHRNMLGFDIKNFGVSGVIPNSATTARFTFNSNGDVYYPGVVALAINLYAPDFSTSAKAVTNTSGNTPARPGDRLTYTVTYNNTGLDAATNVVSTDTLPPNTVFVAGSLRRVDPANPQSTIATLPDSGYDAGSRTITVGLGAQSGPTTGGRMACSGATSCNDDGTSRQAYAFDVVLAPESGGTTVTNQAGLDYVTETTRTPATYLSNPASVDVTRQADVVVTKVMSPNPAPAGAEVRAVLTVTNDGPNAALNTVLTDPVPDGWTEVTISPAVTACSITSGTLRCAFGTLEDGERRTVTLVGRTPQDSAASSLSNTATVTTDSFDTAPANNVASDTVTLTSAADLVVEKTGPEDPVVPGTAVTWQVTARNDGPSLARGVLLYDTLAVAGSARITAVSVTGGTGGVCAPSSGTTALCRLTTLPVGETATMTVTATTSPGLATGTVGVFNTVRGAAVTPDPDLTDNTDSAPLTVADPQADIRMTKEASTPAVPGGQITYTLRATNYGPSNASGITLVDTLPEAVDDVAVSSTRGACEVSGRTVSCTGVDLQASTTPGEPGEWITITITGTIDADATGSLVNSADVTMPPGVTDPDTDNNRPEITTPLSPRYDLSISKVSDLTTVPSAAGQEYEYTIQVRNAGPSVAYDATVTDTLPADIEFHGSLPDGCTVAGDTATCVVARIDPGQTVTLTLPVRSSADFPVTPAPETLTNTAGVSSEDDTNPRNDEASFTHQGSPVIDLAVTKTPIAATLDSGAGIAGTSVGFTIVVQRLDSEEVGAPEVGAAFIDLIPSGTSLARTSLPGGTWAVLTPADGPVYTACLFAYYGGNTPPSGEDRGCFATSRAMEPGDEWEFTISFDLPSGYPDPTLSNTAVVSPDYGGYDVYEPNTANNQSTATVPVRALADVVARELAVTVPAGQTYLGPGSRRGLHIMIGNNGPSDAVNPSFAFSRTLDAYAEPWWETDPDWACVPTTTRLQCTYDGVLEAGDTLTVDYEITIDGSADPAVPVPASAQQTGEFAFTPDAATGWDSTFTVAAQPRTYPQDLPAGTYPDFLRVSSRTPDALATNNAAVDDIVLDDAATRLQVTKEPLPGFGASNPDPDDSHLAFTGGDAFGYEITVVVPREPTEGYADARNVVVEDWLPVGFVPTSATSAGGLCEITAAPAAGQRALVRCQLGDLPGYSQPAASPVTINVIGTLSRRANVEWNTANAAAQGIPTNEIDGPAEQVPNTAVAYPGPASGGGTATPLIDPETVCAPGDLPAVGGSVTACATATTAVDIIERANLRLVKTADQAVANAGGTIGFTLTIVNQGPSDVQHALVTDTFPAGLTLIPDSLVLDSNPHNPGYVDSDGNLHPLLCEDYDAKGADGSAGHIIGDGPFRDPVKPDDYDPDGQTWLCQLLEIPAGTQRSLHLRAQIPDDVDATVEPTGDGEWNHVRDPLVNRANSGAVMWETDESDNQARAAFDIARLTDVSITANVSTTTPAAGQLVGMTGSTVNSGPSTSLNTSGTTLFPPGLVPVRLDVANNACTLYTVPAGSDPADPGNRTVVTSWGTDAPDPATDPAGFAAWYAAQTWTWTSSQISTDANGVPIPSATLKDSTFDGSIQYGLDCGPFMPVQAWEAGGNAANTVLLWIPKDTPSGTYRATSSVASQTPETILANNSTAVELFVNHVSDTAVVKTLVDPGNGQIERGREVTWQVKAYNFGPSVADDVVISDNVPDNTEYVAATVPGGTCTLFEATNTTADANPIIKCQLGSLDVSEFIDADGDGGFDPGETVTEDRSRTITVILRALSSNQLGDEICNAAMIGSSSLDNNAGDATDPDEPASGEMTSAGGNNWSQSCGPVIEPPATDVGIDLEPENQTHRSGEAADLTVRVRNNGPEIATGVTATLTMPEGYLDYSGTPIEWPSGSSQPPDGVMGSLTFAVGTLLPDQEVVYAVTGTATGRPGEVLTVSGQTTHDEPDTVAQNDTDEVQIRILGDGRPPKPGGTLPITGAEVLGWLLAGMTLLCAGTALTLHARRRRHSR